MNEDQEKLCREEFGKVYGMVNDLTKGADGNYLDWNLHLTWECWRNCWETSLRVNEIKAGLKVNKP